MNRYTFTCLWRPPKDHWWLLGAKWRTVVVTMDSMDRPEQAAADACLYLIAVRRGQATAVSVAGGKAGQQQALSHIHFNWNWYSGVVTWGGWVVEVRLEDRVPVYGRPCGGQMVRHATGKWRRRASRR